jgi:hypothetical protein
MTFECHELITRRLIQAFTEAPADPRYGSPGLDQIRAADVKIFERMAEWCRGGVRADMTTGVLPMDVAVVAALADFELALMLQPWPRNAAAARKQVPPNPAQAPASVGRPAALTSSAKKRAREKARVATRLAEGGPPPPPALPVARARANDASKGAGKGPRLPRELIGKNAMSHHNPPERLCFSFNMAGCTDCAPGEKCAKGWHLCMEPGCTASHSVRNHR